jgi:PAS domain S-box-containing protein
MTTEIGTTLTLENLLRHAADGWFAVDKDHRFVLVSDSFERLIGRRAAELIGHECRCGEVVQCKDVQGRSLKGFLCPARYLFDGTSDATVQRMELQRADGSSLWVETAYHVVRDEAGNPRYVFGAMRDITDRKSREDELLQAIDRPREPAADPNAATGDLKLDRVLAAVEADTIRKALAAAAGYRHKAAELLGISRSRLYRRMEALGINPGELD